MAYDEKLAERIRTAAPPDFAISERKMMGGIAFMIDGKIFVGVVADSLLVRVGRDGYEAALARAHVGPMDFTGRPMSGFVLVRPAGIKTARALAAWIEPALEYARALPAKPPRKPRARARTRTTRATGTRARSGSPRRSRR